MLGNDTYCKEIAASGVTVKAGLTYAEMIGRSAPLATTAPTGQETAGVQNLVDQRIKGPTSRDQLTVDGRFLRIESNKAEGGGLSP